jgi:prepilin-type N-terminal cleavage/methylation domain-containing protein
MKQRLQCGQGFTLLELLVATAIFMVICGAMFGLLQISQQKYAIETQLSGSFQEARLGVDQIVRDINISGYPSAGLLSNTANSASYALAPFAWDPGYLSNPPTDCQIGATCSPTPGDSDLIVETDSGNGTGVNWIRYQLQATPQGTILCRGAVPKTAGMDPVAATSASGVMTPLVNNVVYNASGALLAQITAEYPSMFSGGVQPPLFTYSCNTPAGPQPCTSAGIYNAPRYVSDVDITLIVQTPQQDLQTGALKLIELTGRGHRTNAGN